MPSLFFDEALLTDGWATGVRLEIAGGVIAGVETGTRVGTGDERRKIACHGIAFRPRRAR